MRHPIDLSRRAGDTEALTHYDSGSLAFDPENWNESLDACGTSWLRAVRARVQESIQATWDDINAIKRSAAGRPYTRSQGANDDALCDDMEAAGRLRDAIDHALDIAAGPEGTPGSPAPSHSHSGGSPMTTTTTRSVAGSPGEYLTADQSVAQWCRAAGAPASGSALSGPADLDFAKMARGMLTGNWRGAEAEHRDLFESTTPGSGYLVPEIVSAQVIDYARNKARLMQAGARTIPLRSDIQFVPRQTDDPSMQWLAEGATSADGSMTFDRVEFITKTLRVLVKASRELIEDAEMDLADLVMTSIGKAVAVEIDRVGLYGTGPGTPQEPLGLKGQSGVNILALGADGAAPTWDDLSESAERVRSNNFTPGAFILAPRSHGELSRIKDAYGRYLGPPPDIAGNDRLPTNQVPTNLTEGTATTCSDIFTGQWDQLLVGMRTQLRMMTLNERYVSELEVGYFAYTRLDVQLAHPAAFDVLSGVL